MAFFHHTDIIVLVVSYYGYYSVIFNSILDPMSHKLLWLYFISQCLRSHIRSRRGVFFGCTSGHCVVRVGWRWRHRWWRFRWLRWRRRRRLRASERVGGRPERRLRGRRLGRRAVHDRHGDVVDHVHGSSPPLLPLTHAAHAHEHRRAAEHCRQQQHTWAHYQRPSPRRVPLGRWSGRRCVTAKDLLL